MQKPQFVYVVYISSTPEEVWNALIDGDRPLPGTARRHDQPPE